jgi:hypothetical protein
MSKLNKRSVGLPWISSSSSTTERAFGIWAKLPFFGWALDRRPAPEVGGDYDWIGAIECAPVLDQLPELHDVISRTKSGSDRQLYLAMILKFLRTLQQQKRISYRLSG